jgi:hypothetical protein
MHRQRPGFTLLEVILSLGLSVLVLTAVGSALSLHMHLLDSGRTRVEEAQLARSIMRIISQDLQSAVPYGSSTSSSSSSGSGGSTTQTSTNTSASSGPPSMLMTAIGPSLLGQTTGSTTTTGSSSGTSGSGSTDTSDTSDNLDHTSDIINTGPASKPGIYGNATQIQLDISRLPRTDQYMAILNQDTTNAILASDYRNVAYYVVSGSGSQSNGLYRREMCRATGVYASLEGQQCPVTTESLIPIAPEVQEIDFQYTDGTQWLDTWDSTTNGCLPVAVQVTLFITPLNTRSSTARLSTYRMLVSIPAGQPTLTTTSTNSSTTTTSTSSSTTTN